MASTTPSLTELPKQDAKPIVPSVKHSLFPSRKAVPKHDMAPKSSSMKKLPELPKMKLFPSHKAVPEHDKAPKSSSMKELPGLPKMKMFPTVTAPTEPAMSRVVMLKDVEDPHYEYHPPSSKAFEEGPFVADPEGVILQGKANMLYHRKLWTDNCGCVIAEHAHRFFPGMDPVELNYDVMDFLMEHGDGADSAGKGKGKGHSTGAMKKLYMERMRSDMGCVNGEPAY